MHVELEEPSDLDPVCPTVGVHLESQSVSFVAAASSNAGFGSGQFDNSQCLPNGVSSMSSDVMLSVVPSAVEAATTVAVSDDSSSE